MDYIPMEQESSHTIWYVGGAVVVVVVALSLSYMYLQQQPQPAPIVVAPGATTTDQTQSPPLTSGNTVSDIMTDFTQTSDNSAALQADQNSSAQAVAAF